MPLRWYSDGSIRWMKSLLINYLENDDLVDAIPALQGQRGRPRHRPDRAIVPTASWVTVVTMPKRSAEVFVKDASSLFSRGATHNMVADWGDGAGWWNEPLPG